MTTSRLLTAVCAASLTLSAGATANAANRRFQGRPIRRHAAARARTAQSVAAQRAAIVRMLTVLAILDPRTPAPNKRIVWYAANHFGRRVGNGECWTLGAAALAYAGAQPPRWYDFGAEITLAESQPGDILQFTSARFDFPNGAYAWMGAPNHTAVILWRLGTHVVLLHQNFGVRAVTVLGIDMRRMTRGRVQVYRPLAR